MYYSFALEAIVQNSLNLRAAQDLSAMEVTVTELVETMLLAFRQGASHRSGIVVCQLINLQSIIVTV